MKLVIESGSTKSDWVLIDNGKVSNKYKTMGYNPFFHNETIIYNSINQNRELELISKDVKEVFFYGAGCSSPELNKVVHKAFQKVFTKANVVIDHDLLACALATYEGEPSISCILGTGSNSCLFDGENLTEAVPALGYILGDEGSGSYYGKKLLSDQSWPIYNEKYIQDDMVQINKIGDPVDNYPNFEEGQEFYEGRDYNHNLVYANLNYEQFVNTACEKIKAPPRINSYNQIQLCWNKNFLSC